CNLRRQSSNHLRHLATKLLNTIRQDVAELSDQSANAIEGCSAFLDEALADAMHAEISLLLHRLDRHEAHVRPADRLTDCFRIVPIALAALAVGGNEFRCHQPYCVTGCPKT